ncbi:MAG: redoxin domain-containing protein [Ignavibacteria bacterium]|jgi:thiol-disulfide isomerase/thioredoxin|nr:redoxin domain-containing protein [Ignavibacteria bacterium]MCU7505138.1 redoxin domain-containing protein [Ignavibacteria bacterium]MCU7518010.1 redoxin domain-containing protein [Ignavibacteria bacterium]
MKKIILVLLVLASGLFAQSKPVSGSSYTVQYDASLSGILENSEGITLVYAFDYWGTLPSVPNNAGDLFKNVQTPDTGRVFKEKMRKEGKVWKAVISIPEKASLLSYYFTDGTKSDNNNRGTYVSYIYDSKMKPVRNAHFSNVDFMAMAGKSIDEQIRELEAEVKAYPDNFTARFAYWNKKMEKAKDYNELHKTRKEFEKYYTDLKKKYAGNYEVLNIEARTYDVYRYNLSEVLNQEFMDIEEVYKNLIMQIPVEKMNSQILRRYQAMKRNEESKKFNESVVGKDAPEFSFETIKGEKMKLSGLKGKFVLLDFWGTWCGPCVGEIPNLVKAYRQFKEKGFEIVSISSDQMNGKKDKEYLKKFTDEKEMTWNHVLDDGTIHQLFRINHWPTLYLIDKDGKIIRNETALRGADLERTLKEVLPETSAMK